MAALYILLVAVGAAWALWVLFVAMMRLKMLRDTGSLTPAMWAFGYPTLAIGLVLDLAVNVVIGSALFIELPREWTLSTRLWRWSNDAAGGWRQRVALALRRGLLDAVDPAGIHTG